MRETGDERARLAEAAAKAPRLGSDAQIVSHAEEAAEAS